MSMNNDADRALGRVRKMLALANNAGASEGERDNALRMAYATMAKHNLDLLEVEGPQVENDPRAENQGVFLGFPWALHISAAVAELFFCRYLVNRRSIGGRYDKTHCFIGKRSNALAAIELAAYLVQSVNREANRAQRAAGEGYPFQRSFCLGAAMKIRERCRALRSENLLTPGEPAKPGTALVLASLYEREKLANDALVAKIYPMLGTVRGGKRSVLRDAMAAGKRYGDTLNLTRDKTRLLERS